MRKLSMGLAMALVVGACGGDDNQPPMTPASVDTTPPPPAATAEAPNADAKPQPTMAELQERTLKSYVDAMNARDAKKLAALYAEGAVVKAAGAPDATGRDAIGASYQKLFDAFSTYKMAPSRVWTKDDVVVAEWAFNATHTGDLWGIKATEKPVGAQGVDVMWFDKDGLVKEHHVYYDGATILAQIGVSKQKARAVPALPPSAQRVAATGSADEGKNVELAKAMSAAIESKKEADFVAALTDDAEFEDLTMPLPSKGKAEAKKFFKAMVTAFPDAKVETHNAWGVGDFVISESTMTGTNKGAFFGLPATKKAVSVRSLDIVQVKDGKIAKGWSYSNAADFMQQLGHMPAPKAPAAAAAKTP